MDNEDLKGNLIQELADAFVRDEGPTKEAEDTRFNRATGTLIASNTFINYALSHIDEAGSQGKRRQAARTSPTPTTATTTGRK